MIQIACSMYINTKRQDENFDPDLQFSAKVIFPFVFNYCDGRFIVGKY